MAPKAPGGGLRLFDDSRSFITRAFLRAEFDLDFRAYSAEHDAELLQRLRDWDGRARLTVADAERRALSAANSAFTLAVRQSSTRFISTRPPAG